MLENTVGGGFLLPELGWEGKARLSPGGMYSKAMSGASL